MSPDFRTCWGEGQRDATFQVVDPMWEGVSAVPDLGGSMFGPGCLGWQFWLNNFAAMATQTRVLFFGFLGFLSLLSSLCVL